MSAADINTILALLLVSVHFFRAFSVYLGLL